MGLFLSEWVGIGVSDKTVGSMYFPVWWFYRCASLARPPVRLPADKTECCPFLLLFFCEAPRFCEARAPRAARAVVAGLLCLRVRGAVSVRFDKLRAEL